MDKCLALPSLLQEANWKPLDWQQNSLSNYQSDTLSEPITKSELSLGWTPWDVFHPRATHS